MMLCSCPASQAFSSSTLPARPQQYRTCSQASAQWGCLNASVPLSEQLRKAGGATAAVLGISALVFVNGVPCTSPARRPVVRRWPVLVQQLWLVCRLTRFLGLRRCFVLCVACLQLQQGLATGLAPGDAHTLAAVLPSYCLRWQEPALAWRA